MRRFVVLVLATVLLAPSAFSQSRDRIEVFGGYSYLNPDFTKSVSAGVSGWNIAAAVKVFRYVGVVADFSGFSPSGPNPCPSCGGGPFASYHTYMGGPQISARIGRIKPFARLLLGALRGNLTHSDEQFGGDFSSFLVGFGGGLDIGLNRWIAVRGQVDLLHAKSPVSTAPNSSVSDMGRIATGLVVRF